MMKIENYTDFAVFKEHLRGDKYRNFWPRLTETEWEEIFDYALRAVALSEMEEAVYENLVEDDEFNTDKAYNEGFQDALDKVEHALGDIYP